MNQYNESNHHEGDEQRSITGSSPQSRREFLRAAVWTGVGVTAACTVPGLLLPMPAEAGIFPKPSPEQQKKIGAEAAQKVLQQYRRVTDGRARHFEQIGRRLVAALPARDRQLWDFQFYVLDSKEANAFALPGGPMFILTGLYSQMHTNDELAAVTGHEMAHVHKEHWAKAYAKQQERQTLIGGVIALLGKQDNNYARIAAGLADNALGAKFSRGEEDEADRAALQDLVAANFNPNGMLQLFETLQKQGGGGGGGKLGEFLASHPMTSTRITNTKKRIAAMGNRRFARPTPLNYNRLAAR